MPKYSATVQFAGSKAQLTVSQKKRTDGKGWTTFGIEATDRDDAVRQARGLFEKERAASNKEEFGFLIEGAPELLLLSCEAPRSHEVLKWSDLP